MNLESLAKLKIFLIWSRGSCSLVAIFFSFLPFIMMFFPLSSAYSDAPVDPATPDIKTMVDCRKNDKRALPDKERVALDSSRKDSKAGPLFSFTDDFQRDDSNHIGGRWLDCHTTDPSGFEPLGIYGGGIVVPNPFTRPGVYHSPPLSAYSLESGKILPGIGCASIETGTTTVSVSVSGSGNLGYYGGPPMSHVEGTPLLYVTPQNPRYGFGAWISELYGAPVIFAGYIGNPAERFEVIAVARLLDGCKTGTPREVELRAEEPGKVTVWVDGKQISFQSGIGLEPLSLDPTMIHSTRHGFAVDAHLVDPPTNTKTLKAIEAITIRELD